MIDVLTKHADNLKTILELEGEEGQFEYLIDIGKTKGSLEPHLPAFFVFNAALGLGGIVCF